MATLSRPEPFADPVELDHWLEVHHGVFVGDMLSDNRLVHFELWKVAGTVIIVRRFRGSGWDVYVPVHRGNGIAETFAALDEYFTRPVME